MRTVSVDVASARTVAQVHDRVVDVHGPRELQMRHRTVFVGMAAGAIRPIGREFPGYDLRVRKVAAVTAERRPVIHKGWRDVPVARQRPRHAPMARFTGQRRREMLRRLARSHHTIVAAGAWRRDTAMIEPRASEGHGALVTSLAGRAGDDMILRLTERGDTVVAGCAATGDSSVTEFSASRR